MDTEDEVMDVSEIQEAATIEDDDVESIVLEPVGESSGTGSTCDDEELEKIVVEDILQTSDHDMHRATLTRVLFAEANVTELDVLTMVHTLAVRHHLTKVAVQDILDLIKLCAKAPQENMLNTYYLD
ncbi:hypothetical protein Zmor_004012 [Zophobas morio]|uniref:Uncharacterized protein n=1 Tax=Zophobas morio TaxID=2755281 RepID=A0AA38M0M9_9CUCU|nr:hypothetical protein Zmor_004012 [Zophobas morio]